MASSDHRATGVGCTWCASATSSLRAASGDSTAVAACTMHACPVVVGQQKGVGPGLFITCGQPHTVDEHDEAPDA